MNENTAKRLREAASKTGVSSADVARRHGLKPSSVRSFWKRERAAGRLPPLAPIVVKAEIEECDAAEPAATSADGSIDISKLSPIGGPMGLRIPDPDPLLDALRREHSADSWRSLDGMPANVLAGEISPAPSLRKAAVTRAALRNLASLRDGLTGALLKLQLAKRPRRGKAVGNVR